MKTPIVALVAAATLAGSLSVAQPARAEGGRIAAGVAAGLIGGALVGGAIASSRPAYGAPAPVYVEGPPPPPPGCVWRRERYWDGYGWVVRPVQVCY